MPLFTVVIWYTTSYKITIISSVHIHINYKIYQGHHRLFPYRCAEQASRISIHLVSQRPPSSTRSRASFLGRETIASKPFFMHIARMKVVLLFGPETNLETIDVLVFRGPFGKSRLL